MTQIPRGPEHLTCPLRGKSMSKVCHACPWWTQVRGQNPQTGDPADRWDCAMALMPMLMVEQARVGRGVQAATESMRNEIVVRMDNPNPAPQPRSNGHKMIEASDDV